MYYKQRPTSNKKRKKNAKKKNISKRIKRNKRATKAKQEDPSVLWTVVVFFADLLLLLSALFLVDFFSYTIFVLLDVCTLIFFSYKYKVY